MLLINNYITRSCSTMSDDIPIIGICRHLNISICLGREHRIIPFGFPWIYTYVIKTRKEEDFERGNVSKMKFSTVFTIIAISVVYCKNPGLKTRITDAGLTYGKYMTNRHFMNKDEN